METKESGKLENYRGLYTGIEEMKALVVCIIVDTLKTEQKHKKNTKIG